MSGGRREGRSLRDVRAASLSETPPTNGTVAWRIAALERTVADLERKVDRLIMSIVGAALTFTVGVGVFAITVLTQHAG